MGGGTYSFSASTARSTMRSHVSREQIFESRDLDIKMNPKGTLRECCDSDEHPETIPVIIALDVTGSMGSVPDQFIREGMTKMMEHLYQAGLTDSQVLFLGIGDHECDRAPLQVGQFEASDALLDQWLKSIYLESGGGGNDGESYLLAWYYGARHTSLDVANRGAKGYIFTIGDEPTLENLPASAQRQIFGDNGQYSDVTAEELLIEASEKFHVVHIHTKETYSGRLPGSSLAWRNRLKDNCIFVDHHKEIPEVISSFIQNKEEARRNNTTTDETPVEVKEGNKVAQKAPTPKPEIEEML